MKLAYPAFALAKASAKGKCCERRRRSRAQCLSACTGVVDYSVYEAAKIDGANGWKTFWCITVPLLKPTIIMTFIMSINGTLQLFDESVNLTNGGPANATITMSHYIYNTCFLHAPNFGYGSAMAFLVFIIVAILAFINLKVGDTRD